VTEALLAPVCGGIEASPLLLLVALGTAVVTCLTAVVVLATTWHVWLLARRHQEHLDDHG
jgi:hypothetical protein